VGSDYLFPRAANLIIRDLVRANQGSVLGERYRPLGDTDFSAIIAELRTLRPDVVLNTVNGDSNVHFFRALRAADLGAIPVVSFSVAEEGLKAIAPEAFHPNHYAVWSYFQSLPGEANQRFVNSFRQRYGADQVTSDPIEAAYVAVRLWGQAVRDAGTDTPELVNRAMAQQSTAAPSGIAAVDRRTRHLWKQVRIGRARPDGQFELVWESGDTLRPEPFPDYRARPEWQRLAAELSRLGREQAPYFHPTAAELPAGGRTAADRARGVLPGFVRNLTARNRSGEHGHHLRQESRANRHLHGRAADRCPPAQPSNPHPRWHCHARARLSRRRREQPRLSNRSPPAARQPEQRVRIG
jgi:urea transport system substrate-binding protein